MVRALDFYPGCWQTGIKSHHSRKFFQPCLIPIFGFRVVRWGLVRDWTLFCPKWVPIIIKEDFLEEWECYSLTLLPLIICLCRFCIAWGIYSVYISVTTASGSWLFGSKHSILIRTDWVRTLWYVGFFFSWASFRCHKDIPCRTSSLMYQLIYLGNRYSYKIKRLSTFSKGYS